MSEMSNRDNETLQRDRESNRDAPLSDSERAELAELRANAVKGNNVSVDPVSADTKPQDLNAEERAKLGVSPADDNANRPLSEADRRELENFRSEKANANKTPDDVPLPDTHWLNLADGTTVTSKGVASHVGGIPVLRATEIPAELLDGGNPNAEPVHRF